MDGVELHMARLYVYAFTAERQSVSLFCSVVLPTVWHSLLQVLTMACLSIVNLDSCLVNAQQHQGITAYIVYRQFGSCQGKSIPARLNPVCSLESINQLKL